MCGMQMTVRILQRKPSRDRPRQPRFILPCHELFTRRADSWKTPVETLPATSIAIVKETVTQELVRRHRLKRRKARSVARMVVGGFRNWDGSAAAVMPTPLPSPPKPGPRVGVSDKYKCPIAAAKSGIWTKGDGGP
jgi:hypothetical protein